MVLYFFVFRRMGQGGGVLSFGKSRATVIQKGKGMKNFKDVAGIDEAKEEVEELVDFLRNPGKYQRLGGRIPRGVLLVGPPGTGKTCLPKRLPAKLMYRSSRFQAQILSKCSLVLVPHGAGFIPTGQRVRRHV